MDVLVLTGRGQDFANRVSLESGQPVQQCYQCGKCTAGCPAAPFMDYPPHQVVRLVQLGLEEEALSCGAIWLCASCYACTARCPCRIEVARIMDFLRARARRRGLHRGRRAALFADLFLDSVRRHGRVHELEVGARWGLLTGRVFREADLAAGLAARGKLRLRPPRAGGAEEVRRIFREAARLEEGEHG
ncbi:MAG: 4Fe-4S dicluster domain-containing protein [Firmicutes bacterium]|nr:4Fe-4S dicluster domain-containing protein [Bacillota bacterium]